MNYHEKFQKFYNSKEWQILRKRKWLDAFGLCENCQKNGIVKEAREIHHIEPIEKNWKRRLDYNNLIALCSECHNREHERISDFNKFNKLWEDI